MRKLYMFNMVTLDGFFEGPNHDISWHNVDQEFNEFAIQQLKEMDLLLFGRVTYELMANYWPTPAALEDDPIVAGRMNGISKIVVSRTLRTADWNNTRVINEHVPEELLKLKQQPGKEMGIFGSSDLAASLLRTGLIDEIRVIVNPVVLGKGRSLFSGAQDRVKLKLLKTKPFKSGNVLLIYAPATK